MRSNVILLATVVALPLFAAPAASDLASRLNFETGFAPVVKRSLPAVVNVSSSKIVRSTAGEDEPDPALGQFFTPPLPHRKREESLGSGVIVRSDGYILTNEHVIAGASYVKVALADQREFQARVVGSDPKTDVALLKVDATGLPTLPLGDSSQTQPGDFVLAIGVPFGLSQSVTMGIVSAVGRGNLGIEDYEDFIQTDAAINPGNSGGALINASGQLIGINTALLSGAGGFQGVGFAIPINMAHDVMDRILKSGRVVRAWMGITTQPVTSGIAQSFGLPGGPRGALVAQVTPNSPASRAGLSAGDIILAVNGHPVTNNDELSLTISMLAPGTAIRLRVLRTGAEREIPVTLGEEPVKSGKGEAARAAFSAPAGLLEGIDVADLTPDLARGLSLPPEVKGVVVTGLDPASLALAAGLERGDVIVQVDHRPVADAAGFRSAARGVASAGRVLLFVYHKGNTRYLVVAPE
jgi:serine protease Do